jgi:hypothetical protein
VVRIQSRNGRARAEQDCRQHDWYSRVRGSSLRYHGLAGATASAPPS